jgi:hypothetical protein
VRFRPERPAEPRRLGHAEIAGSEPAPATLTGERLR